MRKILLVFVTVLITVSGYAQKTADIGIWGGTSNYFGDLDKAPPFQSFNPNFGAYFRYNFNARVGLRTMFLTGSFADTGEVEGVPWTFDKNVMDLSLQIEINYLRYILGEKKTPFSSYITAGIGVAYFPYDMDPALIALFNPEHNKGDAIINESVIATTIPIGFGIKYNLGPRFGIGAEYQARKIFSDKLDNLDDPLAFINENSEEVIYTSGVHNNDWSGYLGIHITYMIYMGKNACPVYDSKKVMETFRNRLDKNNIPEHVAIIMDGNGRWAEKHGKARVFGHEKGVESVRSVVEGAGEIGIKYLTLYAFSTENWDRPKVEVDALMELLVQAIEVETDSLMKNNVRLSTIGDINSMPAKVKEKLEGCIRFLDSNTGLNLVLALSYSSKWEIINAVKNLIQDTINKKIKPEIINNELFESYLNTAEIPNPELLIRTSGEYRISNFLLWQIAYSELYFTDKLWPDFRKDDLFEAVYDFQNRERRFGKTSEQLIS